MRAARRAGVLEAELQAFLHGGHPLVAARVAGKVDVEVRVTFQARWKKMWYPPLYTHKILR